MGNDAYTQVSQQRDQAVNEAVVQRAMVEHTEMKAQAMVAEAEERINIQATMLQTAQQQLAERDAVIRQKEGFLEEAQVSHREAARRVDAAEKKGERGLSF